ncbi:tRNA uridine-5-carboxymethylaminomethyl(34) synthesis GTPase MnmE [Blochmannia endosymbiont of Colobopsis nipponica]|uniref:tRNA uridine-5-carboxymethylaminomethyl(34) synthesis GTPase MnmE n=1 Tax=Blochmannia endosymbiont of Colobopsis nipponica TaxID=2681987 RepID=UPI0017864C27|nr:tRNA uridine-5-carboxymethylaminomethyl(34) synthesis GTPase MnmE [Blochmannia endosymbiont of Colobopsis nipponica]QOI10835.1 tRNA uridine-5-carboxymethylaminomethyl(34) synthesis GTPase MnmE [Blochmannia endosymbiont of Colobopsis nipponica]
MKFNNETIIAIATPPGHGGIGIIRISGELSSKVSYIFFGKILNPRRAELLSFRDNHDKILDKVICIFFPAPNSFTGENILEIHGHGGPIILDLIVQNILKKIPEIRIAQPGEFSKRAFLNNKIDLTQAEAIIDLINANSHQAVKSAANSLQGIFSSCIKKIIKMVTKLRMFIETDIDFSEENNNLNILSNNQIQDQLNNILNKINQTYKQAYQGNILRDGIKVVISGKPNVGKSSLLNILSERDTAIVTNRPGTTRDIIREYIYLDGIPFHIIDTAGIHKTNNKIERIGIKRALYEIKNADHILYMVDATKISSKTMKLLWLNLNKDFNIKSHDKYITIIRNKIDLTKEKIKIEQNEKYTVINLSIKYGYGINMLRKHLKNNIKNFNQDNQENNFTARRRHLDSLNKASKHLSEAQKHLQHNLKLELLAEELIQANQELKKITGEYHSDDLLDEIFSTFCIGK